ncbi:MAG: shikimate kinase [Clostridia bacterium]|nr:shikimate kinase [Clostridia bacterium]
MLFGVTNVGKTTIGKLLAEKLGYKFYDLDEEVKRYYSTTLEDFVNSDILNTRDKKRGAVIKLIMMDDSDKVFAICPIYYSSNFNRYIAREDVLAIELRDSPGNIFDRIVFSDKNDVVYTDDEYKYAHAAYYLKDIKKDITYYKRSFSKIKNKFDMDGDPPQVVTDRIIELYGLVPKGE